MSATKYKKNLLINFNKIKKEKTKLKAIKYIKFRYNSFWTRTHKNTITDLNIHTTSTQEHKAQTQNQTQKTQTQI